MASGMSVSLGVKREVHTPTWGVKGSVNTAVGLQLHLAPTLALAGLLALVGVVARPTTEVGMDSDPVAGLALAGLGLAGHGGVLWWWWWLDQPCRYRPQTAMFAAATKATRGRAEMIDWAALARVMVVSLIGWVGGSESAEDDLSEDPDLDHGVGGEGVNVSLLTVGPVKMDDVAAHGRVDLNLAASDEAQALGDHVGVDGAFGTLGPDDSLEAVEVRLPVGVGAAIALALGPVSDAPVQGGDEDVEEGLVAGGGAGHGVSLVGWWCPPCGGRWG